MGKTYLRKTTRASWGVDTLEEAMQQVTSRQMGVNEASRAYDIPSRTLRRHITKGSSSVRLGRCPELGYEHEKRLVKHLKALEKVGFACDAVSVKKMAFHFAERLGITHRFSAQQRSAGHEWFRGFLRRNKELSIRKSEGLSVARAKGMNRTDVDSYFELLLQILTENDLLDKPGKIFNVDETGIQINNKPGKVVASKGAKDVYSITSAERGENISLVSCCNAEGYFMPPVLIFKGKNKKEEFSDGLPPGSDVFMNPKSSYINSELFLKWFKNIFLHKKGAGKALLILDGHASHCNAIDLLDVAAENDVVLLCLPSHTTQALQPLDRAFFGPLKTYFFQEAKNWMTQHRNRKLSRTVISTLIGNAWGKAATVAIAVSGFRACGIYPYNPQAIPDHFFSISDAAAAQEIPAEIVLATPQPIRAQSVSQVNQRTPPDLNNDNEKETPSKFLEETNPIPLIPLETSKRKQQALELTSPVNLAKRRLVAEKKEAKLNKKIGPAKPSTSGISSVPKQVSQKGKNKKKKTNTKKRNYNSSSSESDAILSSSATDELSDEGDDFCIECGDYYYSTKSRADWIQCTQCNKWVHETCTNYINACKKCGVKKK